MSSSVILNRSMLSSRNVILSNKSISFNRTFSSTPIHQETLREIETRLKSVRNIGKITKSMKMIATTKLNKAQRAMTDAKAYGLANQIVFNESDLSSNDNDDVKTLYLVISSDKGLCGGIHSNVAKRARNELKDKTDAQIVVIGDKPKAQLSRMLPKNISLSFNQIGKEVPTFADACVIANVIEENQYDFQKVKLIHNRWISALSYDSTIIEVSNADTLKLAPKFAAYEVEDDQLVKDLASFALTNAIYAALVEGYATEISARRNAMDNATTNSQTVIGGLQMKFNRMRQSKITNDLVDIITGANAL